MSDSSKDARMRLNAEGPLSCSVFGDSSAPSRSPALRGAIAYTAWYTRSLRPPPLLLGPLEPRIRLWLQPPVYAVPTPGFTCGTPLRSLRRSPRCSIRRQRDGSSCTGDSRGAASLLALFHDSPTSAAAGTAIRECIGAGMNGVPSPLLGHCSSDATWLPQHQRALSPTPSRLAAALASSQLLLRSPGHSAMRPQTPASVGWHGGESVGPGALGLTRGAPLWGSDIPTGVTPEDSLRGRRLNPQAGAASTEQQPVCQGGGSHQ